MIPFLRSKKEKELEQVLMSLAMDASNNYKDAAQSNYQKFLRLFQEKKENGKLNEKQISYYEEEKKKWESEMKAYTHKDQKVTW